MNQARIKDQFLYALLAAVFAAIAVVAVWNLAGRRQGVMSGKPEIQVMGAQTPNELMRELSKTIDIGAETDIQALRQEATGL